jgi:hypothetical protein
LSNSGVELWALYDRVQHYKASSDREPHNYLSIWKLPVDPSAPPAEELFPYRLTGPNAPEEGRILDSAGKVAGLAGLGLGVLLLIFRDILTSGLSSAAGLEARQAFAVMLSTMVLTFGAAGVGTIGWLIGKEVGPTQRVTTPQVVLLSVLIVVVIGVAAYIGPDKLNASASGYFSVCRGG